MYVCMYVYRIVMTACSDSHDRLTNETPRNVVSAEGAETTGTARENRTPTQRQRHAPCANATRKRMAKGTRSARGQCSVPRSLG